MTSELGFLQYSTAFGLDRAREIEEEMGLTEMLYLHYKDWGEAAPRVLNLWTSPTHSMKGRNMGVVVTVDRGTCYLGTGIMLFNPNGSANDFHAICLDEGFGFDSTACAGQRAAHGNQA